MNKIKIALASAFMFAAVFGMSAQSALQAEIQKVKQQTEEAAGVVSNDVKKEGKDLKRDAKKVKARMKDDLRKAECKKGDCKASKCEKGDLKKGDCKKGEGKCAKGECKKASAMFSDLNLTAEQQSQIDALFAKRQEKAQADRAQNKADREKAKADKKEKRAAAQSEFNAELQKILTPEQYKAFEAKKAAMKDNKNFKKDSAHKFKKHDKGNKQGKE